MGSVKIEAVGGGGVAAGEKIWDHKGLTQIVQIIVSYGSMSVNSLQFQYLKNDHLHTSEIVGHQHFRGPMFDVITFDNAANEYITKVEGTYGNQNHKIEKLIIHTNKKLYEIFEIPDSISAFRRRFCFNFGGWNQFDGFHGSQTSTGLGGIGVYFNYLTALPTTIHDIPDDPSPNDVEDEDHVNIYI